MVGMYRFSFSSKRHPNLIFSGKKGAFFLIFGETNDQIENFKLSHPPKHLTHIDLHCIITSYQIIKEYKIIVIYISVQ